MTKIKFTQTHIDTRTLAAEDLQKVGVEGFRKRDFINGEVVEVPEEVATALVENAELFGQFELVEDGASTLDIDEETEGKSAEEDSNGKVTKADPKSASAGTTTTAPTTTTSTGRASK